MAKDPAFLFYTADFLAETMFFTSAQIGNYVKLLCAQHQTGHLSEDDMQSLCGGITDEKIFNRFVKDSNGKYYNQRLDLEMIRRREHSEKQRQNALMRWHGNGKADAMPLRTRTRTEARTVTDTKTETGTKTRTETKTALAEYSVVFNSFWNQYPKKEGKAAAWEAWQSINPMPKPGIIIMQALRQAANNEDWKKDNGRWIPRPDKWLSGRRWEDEGTVGIIPVVKPFKPLPEPTAADRAMSIKAAASLKDSLKQGGK